MIIPAVINRPMNRNGYIHPASIYTPEYFVPLLMEGIEPIYEVSNYGRVRRLLENGEYRFYSISVSSGYPTVSLKMTDGRHMPCLLHRLVAHCFCPKLDDSYNIVNHIDSNKFNPFSGNLEWCTQHDNIMHAINYGKFGQLGETNNNARLTEELVHNICQLLQDTQCKIQYSEILGMVGLEPSEQNLYIIQKIRAGRLWKHISCNYNIPKPEHRCKSAHHTYEQIESICKCIQNGMTNREIASLMGIDLSNRYEVDKFWHFVTRIRKRETYTNISSKYDW